MVRLAARRYVLFAVLLGFFSFAATLFFNAPAAHAAAGINSQISFQGKVVKSDGTNIADGTYNMEFKIYQDGTGTGGGTLKWTSDRLVGGSGGVVVTGGTFSVNLGALTSLSSVDFNQDTLWLSMQVGNSTSCTITTTFQANCGGDGEMTPYIRLTAAPYAMNAGLLNGLSSSSFVQLSPSLQQTGNININGSLTATSTISFGSSAQYTVDASGNVSTTGTSTVKTTNSNALSIQNSGGVALLTADTNAGNIILGKASSLTANLVFANAGSAATVSLAAGATGASYTLYLPTSAPTGANQCLGTSSTTQLTFTSCASGHSKTVVLNAEYAGAVLDATNDTTCSSANNGTMTAGSDITNKMNYYNWTSSQTTAQCYDIVVQYGLPSDFGSWDATTPLALSQYVSSTSNATSAVEVRDTANAVAQAFTTTTPASASAWTTTTVSGWQSTGTWTAGGTMYIRIRASSLSSAYIRLGNIKLTYNSTY